MSINNITKTIPPAPVAPSRQDPATFSDKADTFVEYIEVMDGHYNDLTSQYNTFATQANALASQTNIDATTATTQAGIATAAASEAVATVASTVKLTGDQTITGTKTFNGVINGTAVGHDTGDLIPAGGASGALTVGTNDATSLTLKTNNTGRVTVDANGNVGIGGTPLNVLGGGYEGKTLKIGLTGLLMGGGGEEVVLASNFYYDGQSRAIVGGRGSSYVSQYQGAILFNTAPPVTNSNDPITATTAMTIANNGNLLIGTSTNNGVDRLQVNGSISCNGAVKARADVIYNAAVVAVANTTGQKIQVKFAYSDPNYKMPMIEVKGFGQSRLVNFMTRAFHATGGVMHSPISNDFAEIGMTATWYYSSDNNPCVELHYPIANSSEYLAVSINYIGVAINHGAGISPNISATFSTTRY